MVEDRRPKEKPAVICFVGRSNSGKTGLLVRLIPLLKQRGFSVAAVKHHPEPLLLDNPVKDSYRHMEAGADISVIAAPGQSGIFIGFDRDPALDDILPFLSGVDIVLCEGYKRSRYMKIEVLAKDDTPLCLDNTVAVVSEREMDGDVPCFHPHRIMEIASFLTGMLDKDPRDESKDKGAYLSSST